MCNAGNEGTSSKTKPTLSARLHASHPGNKEYKQHTSDLSGGAACVTSLRQGGQWDNRGDGGQGRGRERAGGEGGGVRGLGKGSQNKVTSVWRGRHLALLWSGSAELWQWPPVLAQGHPQSPSQRLLSPEQTANLNFSYELTQKFPPSTFLSPACTHIEEISQLWMPACISPDGSRDSSQHLR